MVLSTNPKAFENGYISMMRNMFLTSSIGFGTIAFSKNFKQYQIFVQIFALIILSYSIIYGLKSANDYKIYLDYLKSDKDLPDIYIKLLGNWNQWITLTYAYIAILLALSIIIFIRKIK
jgi:hypothetical protein